MWWWSWSKAWQQSMMWSILVSFQFPPGKKASDVEIIPKVRHNIKGEGEPATTEESEAVYSPCVFFFSCSSVHWASVGIRPPTPADNNRAAKGRTQSGPAVLRTFLPRRSRLDIYPPICQWKSGRNRCLFSVFWLLIDRQTWDVSADVATE